ncbi:MAG: REP element-mobilizing transposase RayT [Rickettsiales bacterium]|jgi:REP element-mobilizing transposase RayT
MKYNPKVHHRRSIRLKDYDYSQGGAYFITICCEDKKCLFGKIINKKMVLNSAGKMIDKWCLEIPKKFPAIELAIYQIMPNHFHMIIINHDLVGADLCVRPNVANINYVNIMKKGGHIGPPLQKIIQWLKTMTTNEYIRNVKKYGWQSFNKRIWQRNYYEHVIRTENSYQLITDYILTNPAKWLEDKLYVQ